MIGYPDARKKAQAHLEEIATRSGGNVPLQLLEAKTLERPFGWVFFYQSDAYLKTASPSDALAGNGPLVVTGDGVVHETGTAYPLEHYLRAFEM